MDGIGGVVIGNAFNIPDSALPKRYREKKVAYIVTGVNHSIQNNDWTTTIEAQTLLMMPPKGFPLQKFIDAQASISGVLANSVDTVYNRLKSLIAKIAQGASQVIQVIQEVINNNDVPVVPPNQDNVKVQTGGTTRYINKVLRKNGEVDDLLVNMNPDLYKRHWSPVCSSDQKRIRLLPQAMKNLEAMLIAAWNDGIYLKINSCYRTYNDQVRIWGSNCSNAIGSGKCKAKDGQSPAAIAGTSNHGFGMAIDIANEGGTKVTRASSTSKENKWLQTYASTYGFRQQNSSNEQHHYNYINPV